MPALLLVRPHVLTYLILQHFAGEEIEVTQPPSHRAKTYALNWYVVMLQIKFS
jgi:hypothetical protein